MSSKICPWWAKFQPPVEQILALVGNSISDKAKFISKYEIIERLNQSCSQLRVKNCSDELEFALCIK